MDNARSLTHLLYNEMFGWTEEANEAFKRSKHAMITLLVLPLPDFSLPFVINTHVSVTVVGVLLY